MMENRKIEKNMGTVWEYLKMGYTVELNDYMYAAIEDEKTHEWHLCIKTQQFLNGSFVGEDIYIDANHTVDEFDKLVQQISDADYFLLTIDTLQGLKPHRFL